MDLELSGRVVLVVGGTGLIGSAVVRRLREEGAIAIAAARGEGAELRLDAADPASVATGIERVLADHGRIDGLVVAAAPSARTLDPARNSDPEQAIGAIDGKVMTFLRVANAVLPTMTAVGYGRIVGVSGQNAFVTGNLTGSVRNAAVIITAKNLADSVAGSGVTVNAVSPGIVREDPAVAVEPGRGGESTPAQVADLITFLISPRAGGISGESMVVGHRVRGHSGL